MTIHQASPSAPAEFLRRHLLGLLVSSYVLAAVCPSWGLRIKELQLREIALPNGSVTISLPTLLLALLLFNAGLSVRPESVWRLIRRPTLLLLGVTANLTLPLLFVLGIMVALRFWHNAEEAATILVGLAVVAAMPVAGSSTGWARSADGDMALSLGLVLTSTLLSPLTTPAAFHLVRFLSPVGFADELHRLTGPNTTAFLTAWVLLPSLVGFVLSALLGQRRSQTLLSRLKSSGTIALLLLCYTNASSCLPQVLGTPDWDFLGIMLGLALVLCVLTFGSGYAMGRLLGANHEQKVALMFGLGMNNNGTGLVLASVALASHPLATLPIIAYNLTQHLAAGCALALLRRASTR